MYNQRKAAKRFTLLLLEEEEDYVQDWVATCKWPANVSGCWAGHSTLEGRVRLCTRSLFFDPDDVRVPIVRLPFNTTQSLTGGSGGSFSLVSTSLVKMKANMEEVPYGFEKGQPSTWEFTLLYAPLASLLPMAQQLLASNKQPKIKRTLELEAFVRAREDTVAFDTSRLADFSERILLDMPAIQLTPLVRERGHLVVTDTRLYFQPMHNVSGDMPVRSHPLAGVAAMARRRSCLRPLGLELFFVRPSDTTAARRTAPANGQPPGLDARVGSGGSMSDLELMGGGQVWDAPSAFFAFRTEHEREAVASQLSSCPGLGAAVAPLSSSSQPTPGGFTSLVQAHSLLLEAQGGWLYKVTAAWQAARVSNFDYLMYLNLAAGRSFNDLAQWPVFPWVVSNWVSERLDLNDPANFRDLTKPVGALNPTRLGEFRKRYLDMPTDMMEEGALPPFMYGTHYSTPGYVMYWLLRAAPAHMLRLQNGRFDAPDRLFHGLQESWESVNNSTTDVKELIPEFYLPGGSWLVNSLRLPLGVRQSGQPVGDVELPPWARDTEHLLAMHRAALESPPVSCSLHHWIDLVFGFKQTGPEAEASDNVFFHLTYEGAVDVSKVSDPVELKALETQINEFGQTPRKLFHHPHPPRKVIPPAPNPDTIFSTLVADGNAAGGAAGGVVGSSAVTPTAAGGGVTGSETGHRALAMALISALSQAAALPAGEETPVEPSPTLPPATPASPPPFPNSLYKGGSGSTAVPGHDDAHGSQSSLHADGATHGTQGSGSHLGSASSIVTTTASSITAVAGGLFSGLLKLGRYQPAAATNVPPNAPSPALPAVTSPHSVPVPPLGTAPATHSAAAEALNHGRAGSAGSWAAVAAPVQQDHTASPALDDLGSGALDQLTDVDAILHTLDPHISPTDLGPAAAPTPSHSQQALVAAGTQGVTTPSHSPGPGQSHSPGPGHCPVTPARWSVGLVDRLIKCDQPGSGCTSVTMSVSRDPIAGVATWRSPHTEPGDSSSYICSASAGGMLKVTQMTTPSLPDHTSHTVLRSQQLEGDLLCLAAVPGTSRPAHGSHGAMSPDLDIMAATWHHTSHPLILTGSHNQRVYAYDVAAGHLLGSFIAHDDAVCALALPALPLGHHALDPALDHMVSKAPGRFFTSSWDCTIKVWTLAEGRQPWTWAASSLAPSPEVVMDLGEGVWALAPGQDGSHMVVAGTEEGRVVSCDLRTGRTVWSVPVAQDYVGGVSLSPCGQYVASGTADGTLALLDVRNLGSRLAMVSTDSPVRCCASDGWLLLAGGEAGAVQLWDIGLMSVSRPEHMGGTSAGGTVVPELDGLFEPWLPHVAAAGARSGEDTLPDEACAVSCLGVWPWFDGEGKVCVQVVAGREDGSVVAALCT